MFNRLFFVAFLTFYSIPRAQAPDTLWTRTLGYDGSSGDRIYSVQQTSDGGFIVCGDTQYNGQWAALANVFYAKLNSMGIIEWQRFIDEQFNEFSYSIKQTSDGGYVIGGTNSSEELSGIDMYLLRTNSIGDTLWTRTYGGNDDEDLHELCLTADGGFLLAGCTNSFESESRDMYIVHVDASGNQLWEREYRAANDQDGECANSAKQTSDGGFVFVGDVRRVPYYREPYLVKTNQAGDTLWTRRYSVPTRQGSPGGEQIPTFVDVTQDGGFIIAGYGYNYESNADFLVIKTDDQGDTLWTRMFGRLGDDKATVIRQCADGGFIVGGYTGNHSDWLAIRLNSEGDSIWSYHFGGVDSDRAYDLVQTIDGGFAIAGWIWDQTLGVEGLVIRLASETVGAIDESHLIPSSVFLSSCYPNPFNSMAEIAFEVSQPGPISLKVYDLQGSELTSLFEGSSPAGRHTVTFDAANYPSGVYFCRLTAGHVNETLKLVLLK